MWPPYGTGGLVVQSWTDTNSSAWQKFDQQAATDPTQNVIYSGTFGPLGAETTSDGCHANEAGQTMLGNQAVAFFDDGGVEPVLPALSTPAAALLAALLVAAALRLTPMQRAARS